MGGVGSTGSRFSPASHRTRLYRGLGGYKMKELIGIGTPALLGVPFADSSRETAADPMI